MDDDADARGTLVLQLVHHHIPAAEVRLRVRDASRALRETVDAGRPLDAWAALRAARDAWTAWRDEAVRARERARARTLRPVVLSWSRRRRVRTDETPVLGFL